MSDAAVRTMVHLLAHAGAAGQGAAEAALQAAVGHLDCQALLSGVMICGLAAAGLLQQVHAKGSHHRGRKGGTLSCRGAQ